MHWRIIIIDIYDNYLCYKQTGREESGVNISIPVSEQLIPWHELLL